MVSANDMQQLLRETKLSVTEAARRLDLHPCTVTRWITQGKRGVHLLGRRGERTTWYTSEEALARFLAAVTNLELEKCRVPDVPSSEADLLERAARADRAIEEMRRKPKRRTRGD
jgi:transposase